MSVSGTVTNQLPQKLFLPVDSTRLESARRRFLVFPSRLLAYAVKRSSTRPPGLRSGVPLGFNTDWRGQSFHWTTHRLRLWGLDLGTASPCADCHGAGTLGFTVSGVFTQICAYSFRHPHFRSLQANVSTGPSLFPERSPTPHTKYEGQASAGRLIPTILGAFPLDE